MNDEYILWKTEEKKKRISHRVCDMELEREKKNTDSFE